MYDLAKITLLILCCIFLYKKFCYKPKVKVYKVPKPEEIKQQRKKERRLKKIKRHFKIPYRGKTQIIEYDKTKPYIESAWNEIEKHK